MKHSKPLSSRFAFTIGNGLVALDGADEDSEVSVAYSHSNSNLNSETFIVPLVNETPRVPISSSNPRREHGEYRS